MRRIDRETTQRILDAADIVEVVSDFVQLRRRGANYIGLCPFHNERTPSFSVSKSRGICKCFSCGKGGSPVNFLMELENLTYNEALRWLAKKYNIEIREHEMTEQEREAETARESMFAINEFAMNHFEQTMLNTPEGRNVGLSYFRQRGINDAMIKRFHLGYSLDKWTDLYNTATREGYNEKYLIDTGLCSKSDNGKISDRFRGRVIYPVHTISGKVVAFGGRTLRTDKEVAKYVNSKESIIYTKSNELYGLYQARQAIGRKDKCILVEGYMDVISMHQAGVENVVASSGTSLTPGQIRLIHRFTDNVTVIYDSDPAGIKASLRGIDLLLAEGMNIKVLLLPEGDDPDSFAQTHSSTEVEEYLAANETDFITFKTKILLDGTNGDPIERARAISSIVQSISKIPDDITRSVYISECSRTLGIEEKTISLQVAKFMAENAEQEATNRRREENRINAGLPANPAHDASTPLSTPPTQQPKPTGDASYLYPCERELVRLMAKYGQVVVAEEYNDASQTTAPQTVMQYILAEMQYDEIVFFNPEFEKVTNAAIEVVNRNWDTELTKFNKYLIDLRSELERKGTEEIRAKADSMASIEQMEKNLNKKIEATIQDAYFVFCEQFISRDLMSHPDDDVRREATALVTQKHSLSKIHTKYSKIDTERDRLTELLQHAIYNLKEAHIELQIKHLINDIRAIYSAENCDMTQVSELMAEQVRLNDLKKQLAKYLGERVLVNRR